MERVFYNLLLNAAQAARRGRDHGEDARGEWDRGGGRDRSRAGVDPKIMEQIFNPFFTTKPDGVGSGWPLFPRSWTSTAVE
jgi:signal transduction histidine kinase